VSRDRARRAAGVGAAGLGAAGPLGSGRAREEAKLGERTERRVFIDLAPLRRSRDLRCLVLGELVSVLGTQTADAGAIRAAGMDRRHWSG
jgi:hypothetical protein